MRMLEKNPSGVKKADLIVGIPSHNEAASIAFPTEQAAAGLKQHFAHLDTVVINCDNNSTDGTAEAFLNADTQGVPKIYLSTPEGIKGKGNNIRNLCKKALELDAKAVVIIDADLVSVTPAWIKNLGEPLFKDFGYVAPLYMRHKYEDALNSMIVYPLTRSLYGRRVKQPKGGEFGFSRAMVNTFLKNGAWNEEIAQYGIDIWMTTLAMNEGVPICQAFLGRPKLHRARDPIFDPGLVFRQILTTIFTLMETYHDKWNATKWSKPTAIFGFGGAEPELPAVVEVNRERLYQRFKSGFTEHWETYRMICSTENFQKLREIASLSREHFEIPMPHWAKILYDFALAFHKQSMSGNKACDVLMPLYIGMVLSFVNKTEGMSMQQADEVLEDLCLHFEQTKPYLRDRWK